VATLALIRRDEIEHVDVVEAEPAFYSYDVNDADYPGRVTFIPFDQLPHR
jgi:hypothetical protein